MDANTVLTVWLILSGLGHLILMVVVWSDLTFKGMRIRRLIFGTTCWYIALRLPYWHFEGWLGSFVTGGAWFVAVGGTFLLLGSAILYRSGRDLGKFP